MRWLWRAPVLVLLAYLAAGTVGGIPFGSDDVGGHSSTRHILLVKGPIHTDIALPVTDAVTDRFGWLKDQIPVDQAGFLLFGWGAKEFYTSTGTYADLAVGPVWRAATGDRSVMRVDVIPSYWAPQQVTEISLTEDQLARLIAAIEQGFSQPPRALGHPGFTSTDVFFDGAGQFHLFRTCNVWVGEVLEAAGVRVGPWTPFTWSLP